MSIECMNRVWKESKLKASNLLLLLAIADSADDDGYAWPGINYLIKKTRMSRRSIINLISSAEHAGELIIDKSSGEVNRYIITVGLTTDHINKTIQLRQFHHYIDPEKTGVTRAKIAPPPPVQSLHHSRAKIAPLPVQRLHGSGAKIAPDPLKKHKKETSEETKKGASASPKEIIAGKASSVTEKKSGSKRDNNKSQPDPRINHPAIQAVRGIISRYPVKLIWDDIIKTLGDEPDLEKLNRCAAAWAKKSTNIGNLDVWLFDWFVNGIPQTNGNGMQGKLKRPDGSRGSGRNWKPGRTDEV